MTVSINKPGSQSGDNTDANSGDIFAALQRKREEIEQARSLSLTLPLQEKLTQSARLLARLGRFSEAIAAAQEARQIDPLTPPGVDALIVEGICLANTDDLITAEARLRSALEISRQIGDSEHQGSALHNLATSILAPRGQFTQALAAMQEASLFKTGSQAYWGVAFLRAYIYHQLGDRAQMRQALDDYVPLVEPGTRTAGAYYYLWALIALDDEEYEKAYEYLRLTLRVAVQTGEIDLDAWVREGYSRYQRSTGHPAAALTWADQAVTLTRKANSLFLLGQALIERGLAYWSDSDLTRGLADLDEALQVCARLGAAFEQARAAFYRAALLQAMGDPAADAAFEEAAALIQRGHYTSFLVNERGLSFPLIAGHLRSPNRAVRRAAEGLMEHLAQIPPTTLHVRGLGQFSVWQGRRQIDDQVWQRRKAGELFRYLMLRPGHMAARDEVLDALWPEHLPDTAVELLHQATSALRHVLEPDLPTKFPSRYLSLDGEKITLRLPAGSTADFESFEQEIPPVMRSGQVERLQSLLSMYAGDLFPMDQYADWAASRRERMRELHQHGLLALGRLRLKRGDYADAIECARQLTAVDAWDEDAAELGMQACAQLGDLSRALRFYHTLEQSLQNDLKIAPRAELRALAESLRAGQ